MRTYKYSVTPSPSLSSSSRSTPRKRSSPREGVVIEEYDLGDPPLSQDEVVTRRPRPIGLVRPSDHISPVDRMRPISAFEIEEVHQPKVHKSPIWKLWTFWLCIVLVVCLMAVCVGAGFLIMGYLDHHNSETTKTTVITVTKETTTTPKTTSTTTLGTPTTTKKTTTTTPRVVPPIETTAQTTEKTTKTTKEVETTIITTTPVPINRACSSEIKLNSRAEYYINEKPSNNEIYECRYHISTVPGNGLSFWIYMKLIPNEGDYMSIYHSLWDEWLPPKEALIQSWNKSISTPIYNFAINSNVATLYWRASHSDDELDLQINSVPANYCDDDPCKYKGATCLEVESTFYCVCPEGVMGGGEGNSCHDMTLCDMAVTCQHGTCKLDNETKYGFKCECDPGYQGALCQNAKM